MRRAFGARIIFAGAAFAWGFGVSRPPLRGGFAEGPKARVRRARSRLRRCLPIQVFLVALAGRGARRHFGE